MSNSRDSIEWTPEVVLSLRQLWDEGHSTADIVPLETAVVGPARLLSETSRFPLRPASTPAKPVAHAPTTRAPSSPDAVGNNPCCWPIGEPGKGGFRFCDSSALIGKPYCLDHAHLAYRRVRRRDDDDCMAAQQ
jgi:GcrA cell cycle regulator